MLHIGQEVAQIGAGDVVAGLPAGKEGGIHIGPVVVHEKDFPGGEADAALHLTVTLLRGFHQLHFAGNELTPESRLRFDARLAEKRVGACHRDGIVIGKQIKRITGRQFLHRPRGGGRDAGEKGRHRAVHIGFGTAGTGLCEDEFAETVCAQEPGFHLSVDALLVAGVQKLCNAFEAQYLPEGPDAAVQVQVHQHAADIKYDCFNHRAQRYE